MSVDLDAFTRTYHFHCHRKGVKPLHNPAHKCKPESCTFWTHPRAPMVYMCEISGKIHECGKKCKVPPLETKDGHYVCPLTGVVSESRVYLATYSSAERALHRTEYSAKDQKDNRWRSWECSALNTMKKVANCNNTQFASSCIIIYEKILNEHAGFFRNNVHDFCVFCLAVCFLCKTGVQKGGIPKLEFTKTFPALQELPKRNINLTHFNKAVRHIVKRTQKSDSESLFTPLKWC